MFWVLTRKVKLLEDVHIKKNHLVLARMAFDLAKAG